MKGLIFGILRYFDAGHLISGKGIQLRSPPGGGGPEATQQSVVLIPYPYIYHF